MTTYDFFIAGRWRNKDNIRPVLDAVRASGKTAYCFIENAYEGELLSFDETNPEHIEAAMQESEAMQQDHPMIRKIFETDMGGERASAAFLLVLPAGTAAHIEAGVAYGMGKKCYAVGVPEKTETLYCIFDKIFPDILTLEQWLKDN
ncbi:MAG TPA: hypothetical protein VLF62_02785, partial [Candidatus Saccharimonadales bacterium]|nr:hypothetical protein [Candidatus Saccharimonadales bacterium]